MAGSDQVVRTRAISPSPRTSRYPPRTRVGNTVAKRHRSAAAQPRITAAAAISKGSPASVIARVMAAIPAVSTAPNSTQPTTR